MTSQLHSSGVPWPWSPDDLRPPDDGGLVALSLWSHMRGWLLLTVTLGILAGCITQSQMNRATYTQILRQNASWVTSQSAQEAACFKAATSEAQQDACAKAALRAINVQTGRFEQAQVPDSLANAATQMQHAFQALRDATCYDELTHRTDSDCLGRLAPSLRNFAVLNAREASLS